MKINFDKILRELREEKRLRQKDLAEALSVERTKIVRWESGQYEPNLSEIIKIADFFGVTTDELIGRDIQESSMNIVSKLNAIKIEPDIIYEYENLTYEQQLQVRGYIQGIKDHKEKRKREN